MDVQEDKGPLKTPSVTPDADETGPSAHCPFKKASTEETPVTKTGVTAERHLVLRPFCSHLFLLLCFSSPPSENDG